MSGQWFSGWAACVAMKAAPANPSDPKNILLNWGKSPSGPTGTSLSSLPVRLLSPLHLVPFRLCCSRLFLPLSSPLISLLCHPSRGWSAALLGSARPVETLRVTEVTQPSESSPFTAGPQPDEGIPALFCRQAHEGASRQRG